MVLPALPPRDMVVLAGVMVVGLGVQRRRTRLTRRPFGVESSMWLLGLKRCGAITGASGSTLSRLLKWSEFKLDLEVLFIWFAARIWGGRCISDMAYVVRRLATYTLERFVALALDLSSHGEGRSHGRGLCL